MSYFGQARCGMWRRHPAGDRRRDGGATLATWEVKLGYDPASLRFAWPMLEWFQSGIGLTRRTLANPARSGRKQR